MAQKSMELNKEIVTRVNMKYLLYIPRDYDRESDSKWPLILFLHGAGERGEDLEIVKRYAIPKMAEQDDNLSFIAVSPQCPAGSGWEEHFNDLDILLEELENSYNIDKDRIYLTGISMGGFGTWNYAMVRPDKFAALVPVCGGADYPELAGVLRDVPVWAFHGARDEAVPIEESVYPVKALKRYEGNVRFTIYPKAGHEVCSLAYDDPRLFKWLLEQRRIDDNMI